MELFQLNTDGGARGNPGPAAIGAVLRDASGKIVATVKKTIGETTNNQAEYQAVIAGLQLAKDHGVSHLKVCADSELIVRQIRGQYKVKNAELQPLRAEAVRLAADFTEITFVEIRREKNTDADLLVNQALDGE